MTELYKRLRPEELDQVIGQDQAVSKISKWLAKKEVPHALLFTGPTGVGKTTLMRILREKLGCSDSDYVELNSASMRGIDTVREIMKRMNTMPIGGRCRVWALDEFHQVSKDAQEALLKALEDTPKHVYFMLSTSQPSKVSSAIQSRCTELKLKPFGDKEMQVLLKWLWNECQIDLADDVRDKIIKTAGGSARKAVVISETCMAFDKEASQLDAIEDPDEATGAINIARLVMNSAPWKEIASAIKACEEEPEAVRRCILAYLSAVLLNSGSGGIANKLACFTKPLYDSGKSGLILQCFDAIQVKK